MVRQLQAELKKIANPQKAKNLQRFFKTGKGEYGEGDMFLGVTVPVSRKIADKYKDLDFSSIEKLLHSKFHEERLIALLILVQKYKKGLDGDRKRIYDFYLKNTKYINNWDLVDLSAEKIVGAYLLSRGPVKSNPSRQCSFHCALSGRPSSFATPFILMNLAKSENVWERRIAVLATFQFIKNNKFDETLKISEMLLNDEHDLIHKAVGWMLREIGKKDLKTEIEFLNKHYKKMPRTMLRYAIEKFPQKLRFIFLKKLVFKPEIC